MHTWSWTAWVGLVMTVALTATNPLYLCLLLLCVLLVAAVAPRNESAVAGLRALLVFGAAMMAISLLIAMVNGTYGDHVLFTVPGPDVPRWLGGLAIGGPVSGEGLVAATVRGLAILCVLAAFGVFNGAVSPHRVLRTAPAALFHAGLVVTVGLTLLPSTIEDVRRIREMRALRGGPGGVRGLPGLIVPAVIGGLDRSMRLAEAMEARGYAAGAAAARGPRLIGAISAPLFLGAGWCWFYYESLKPLGLALGIAGVAAIAIWALAASRGKSTTSLNSEPWTRADRAATVLSAGLALFVLVAGEAGWVDLRYNPFAGLEWPAFAIAEGALVLLSALPAVWLLFAAPAATAAAEPSPTAAWTVGT